MTTSAVDERMDTMSGFGEQRHHGTYDDVAADLAAAARRLAAPLAMIARKKAMDAQAETTRNKRQLAQRRDFTRSSEAQLASRQVRSRIDTTRQTTADR